MTTKQKILSRFDMLVAVLLVGLAVTAAARGFSFRYVLGLLLLVPIYYLLVWIARRTWPGLLGFDEEGPK